MAGQYLSPDEWALLVVAFALAWMAFGFIVTAVVRRGGRR